MLIKSAMAATEAVKEAAHGAAEAVHHSEAFYEDPAFWVAVSFVLFIALILYYKLPGKIAGALDNRADRIRNELEEAKRLREEAQALYADYQRKAEEAMQEADRIVEHAREEAQRVSEKAHTDLQEVLERRRAQAEQKIAQAEQKALDEVRAKAADIAIAAATVVLKEEMQGQQGADMVDRAIGSLGSHLH